MKKKVLFFACMGLAVLGACNGSKSGNTEEENAQITELSDSLQTVNAEKDSVMSLVAEINDGMLQIKDILMKNIKVVLEMQVMNYLPNFLLEFTKKFLIVFWQVFQK